MKTSSLVAFILLMLSGLLGAHVIFREKIKSPDRFEAHFARIEAERARAELRTQLAQNDLAQYRQQVATLIPSALHGKSEEATYPLRQLASVVTETDKLQIERASSLFEKAKAKFRDQSFEEASGLFEELLNHYPDSIHIVEANFLLAESKYQIHDLEAAVATIERMITLFPENDLTGFALLRLGRIFETEDRIEDATDIYRAVLANFNNPDLHRQAEASLKAVAL